MELSERQKGLLNKRIIKIYGEIDGHMVDYVRECLETLIISGSPKITVIFSSYGGNIISGLAIYDLLILYKGKIIGRAINFCHSTAIFCLQACDAKEASRHSSLLAHNLLGNKVKLDLLLNKKRRKKYIANLKRQQKLMNDIFLKKTKFKNIEELKKFLAKNKVITAKKAKKLGLIDKII
ncbi:MAG: ATP-dependent Clp protease proteolytic subunit [bacterium]